MKEQDINELRAAVEEFLKTDAANSFLDDLYMRQREYVSGIVAHYKKTSLGDVFSGNDPFYKMTIAIRDIPSTTGLSEVVECCVRMVVQFRKYPDGTTNGYFVRSYFVPYNRLAGLIDEFSTYLLMKPENVDTAWLPNDEE
jgi:hypothetical protein